MTERCQAIQALVDAATRREESYGGLGDVTPGSPSHHRALLALGEVCREVHSCLAAVSVCAHRCQECSWLVQSLTVPDLILAVLQDRRRATASGKGEVV